VFANAPDPFSRSFPKELQLAGEATGTTIAPIMIQDPDQQDCVQSNCYSWLPGDQNLAFNLGV
jgi:hypothetical protein